MASSQKESGKGRFCRRKFFWSPCAHKFSHFSQILINFLQKFPKSCLFFLSKCTKKIQKKILIANVGTRNQRWISRQHFYVRNHSLHCSLSELFGYFSISSRHFNFVHIFHFHFKFFLIFICAKIVKFVLFYFLLFLNYVFRIC